MIGSLEPINVMIMTARLN